MASTNFSLNDYLIIDTTGSIGIGTTTPGARLFVTSSSTVTSQPGVVFKAGTANQTGGAPLLDVQNSTGTTLLFVSGSGRIGVGTTPSASIANAKLEVNGSVIPTTHLNTSYNLGEPTRYWGTTYTNDLYAYNAGTNSIATTGGVFQVAGPVEYSIYAGTTNRVGIGAVAVSTVRLVVSGTTTGSDTTLRVRHGIANGSSLPVLDVQNNAGTSLLLVSGSGNVTLAASPNPNFYRFVTDGDVALYTSNDSTGTNNIRLNSSTSMPQGTATIGGIKTAVGGGDLTISTATGGTLTERLRVLSAGTVGVSGSIEPGTDNSYSLGSSSPQKRWANVYATNIYGSILPTSFTPGSVVYVGASGALAQTNASFYWDYTNNRLGVGTSSPSARLHVSGSTSGTSLLVRAGTATESTVLNVQNNAGTSVFFVDYNGNVRAGTSGAGMVLDFRTNGTNRLDLLFSNGSTWYINPDQSSASGISFFENTYGGLINIGTRNSDVSNQLRSGNTLQLDSRYWNGSTSVVNTATIQNVVYATTPTYNLRLVAGSGNVNILNTGYVGIGTTDPLYTLSITGRVYAHDAFGSYTNAGWRGNFYNASQGKGVAISYDSSSNGHVIQGLASGGNGDLNLNYYGGNVGVGGGAVNTPSARLHVSGSATASTPTMIVQEGVVSPTGGARTFEVKNSAGTSLFSVSGSGNVGVGTTNPSGKFEVVGTSGSLMLVTDNLSGSLFSVNDVTGLPIFEVFSDDTVVAGAVGTNALVVTGSRVGVGTNGPSTNLHVVGTNSTVRVQNSAATAKYVQLRSDASNSYLEHTGGPGDTLRLSNGAAGVIDFYINGSERMKIDSSGNVGIGTNTTNGNRAAISGGNLSVTGSVLPGDNGVSYDLGSTSYKWRTLYAVNISGSLTPTGATAGSVFFAGASGQIQQDNANFFWDDTNNRLGILTNGPSYPLDVNGTSRYAGLAYYDASESINFYGARGRFTGESMHLYNKVAIGYPSGWGGDVSVTPTYGLSTYGGAILSYNQGTVGIGTSSAVAAKLHVQGSTTTSIPTVLIKETQAMANAIATLDVQNSAGTSILYVTGSGFVGVGTNIPGIKLDTWGGSNTAARFVSNIANTNPALASEPGVMLYNLSLTNGNYMSITNRDATYNANAQINFINVDHSANGAINFVTRANTDYTTRMWINQTGNIGIGSTSTISARLQVSGSSTVTDQTMLVKGGAPSQTGPVFEVENNLGATLFVVSGSPGGNVGIGTGIPSAKFEIVGVSGSLFSVADSLSGSLFSVNTISGLPILEVFSDNTVKAGAYNTNALVVTGSLVGVGTSSPGSPLDVSSGKSSGTGGIRLGAEVGLGTRTNSTRKIGVISVPHYTNAQNDFTLISGDANTSTNTIYIGGAWTENAATEIRFYTAANSTTTSGTARALIDTNGHLLPGADNTYNLGASGTRWSNIYGTNIYGAVTPTGFTAGSVVFAGTSGVLAQNNSQFYWDNTNNRLGIGTSTVSYALHINTDGISQGSPTVALVTAGAGGSPQLRLQNGTATWTQRINASTGKYEIYNVGVGVTAVTVTTTAPANSIYADTLGVGIGTNVVSNKLSIYDSSQDQIYIKGTSTNRAGIRIDNTAGYQSQILLTDGGTDKWQFGKQTDNTFFVYDATATKNIIQGTYRALNRSDLGLVPYQDGRVGIGTDPSTNGKLEVYATGSLQGIFQSNGTRWMRYMAGTTTAGAYNSITQANDNALIFSDGSQDTGALVIAPWASGTKGIRMDNLGQVGIGTATMSKKLVVYGSDALINDLTVGRGGSGDVTNSTLGNSAGASFTSSALNNVAVGYSSLNLSTAGERNVAVGSLSLYKASGNYNTAVGHGTLSNLVGTVNGNTAVGYNAFYNLAGVSGSVAVGYLAGEGTTGADNTLIGYLAAQGGGGGMSYYGNVAVGTHSMRLLTTGYYNTSVGWYSGESNTTGILNTFIGAGAGLKNGSGSKNTVIGTAAFQTAITSDDNVSIGYWSMKSFTGGGQNVSIGNLSMYYALTNTQCIAIGHESLKSATTVLDAVAVGFQSQLNTTTGGNVSIGSFTLNTLSSNSGSVAVGYEALRNATGKDNNAMGWWAGRSISTGQFNVAVGTHSLRSVTTTSYSTSVGDYALEIATGNGNAAFGYGAGGMIAADALPAGTSFTGEWNTFVGTAAGYRVKGTASANVAVGNLALRGQDAAVGGVGASGDQNVAIGYWSMLNASTGSYNTAVGSKSLASVSVGVENVAVGNLSLANSTTGSYNVAVGSKSLYSSVKSYYNTAIGKDALYDLQTGYPGAADGHTTIYYGWNTAVGNRALRCLKDGYLNIGIGYNAGYYLTGSGNVVLGSYDVNTNQKTHDANIYIADGGGNLRIFVTGSYDNASGSVGIGTTNILYNSVPSKMNIVTAASTATNTGTKVGLRLHNPSVGVFGATSLEWWSDVNNGSSEWRPGYIVSGDDGNIGSYSGQLQFYTNGTGGGNRYGATIGMVVANGKVGIGTTITHSSAKLHVVGGNIRVDDTYGIDFSATADAAGMTSELLDDYEEGTWTPAFGTTGAFFTSPTYSVQSGHYTKIGRLVHVRAYIVLTDRGSQFISGDWLITGLPYTSANVTNNYSSVSVGQFANLNANMVYLAGTVQDLASATILMRGLAAAGVTTGNLAYSTYVSSSTQIIISATYVAAF